MKTIKLLLTTIAMLLCSVVMARPHDFEKGGIFYNILSSIDLTVEVTYKGYTATEWREYSGVVIIPSTVTYNGRNYSVTSIGENAFYGCSSLTSVTIPNSVTSIGNYAFYNCSSLTSVTIPNSVTSIGWEAFWNTGIYNDTSNWENHVLYMDNCLIRAEKTISGACIIKESTRLIAPDAFQRCDSLSSVTIPNSVISIGSSAFSGCTSLTEVTIPNSVTSIESRTFEACSSLTSITIPNSVTSIGKAAFIASSLTYITIPNSVTSIGEEAFRSCESLTSITIPNSVTSIGEFAFYCCYSLTSITIPNSVTSIESYTFGACTSLAEIAIPNTVTDIGEDAFRNCIRLGKVTLGSSIKNIAANAFALCTRLYDVYCYATYPPFVDDSAFANYNVYLYVPCKSQRDYMLDIVWGKFKFVECIDSEDVTTDGVVVTPSTNDVTIVWPTEDNADNYAIVIEKDGEVFCTLSFNADGQLLNIAFAPSRDGNNHPAQYAGQAGNGYRFTVTGLEAGTHYTYNIDVRDAANKTIKSHSGEFTTEALTVVEEIEVNDSANVQKLLHNGQVLILRDGKIYNVMGQEM